MIRKATFTMELHSKHVHSNRFAVLDTDQVNDSPIGVTDLEKIEKFNVYIPKPLADGAKKIRVTVEVIE